MIQETYPDRTVVIGLKDERVVTIKWGSVFNKGYDKKEIIKILKSAIQFMKRTKDTEE